MKRNPVVIRQVSIKPALFNVTGPHANRWDDINPKKLSASAMLDIAARIGLTYEELGKVVAVLCASDQAAVAKNVGIDFAICI